MLSHKLKGFKDSKCVSGLISDPASIKIALKFLDNHEVVPLSEVNCTHRCTTRSEHVSQVITFVSTKLYRPVSTLVPKPEVELREVLSDC